MKLLQILIILFLFLSSLNAQKVTLQLQWKNQFQFAGYYIAKEKGFYNDVDLDVELLEYKNGENIINKVLSGSVNYATGRSSLVMERANGKNIVLLSSILQSSPLALVTKHSSGIDKIEKFENKRFSHTLDEIYTSLYPILLSHNIDKKSLTIMRSKSKLEDLLTNKTDIIALYSSNQEYYFIKNKINYNIFHAKDYGFDFYSDLLYTSEEESSLHKKRTINFTKASLKGWQYAFDNMEETVDIILKKYNTQNKTKEELLYEAKSLKKLAYANNKPLGDIDPNKIERINDIYHLMGLTKSSIDYGKFIFNLDNTTSLTKEEQQYLKEHKIITMCNNNNWKPITFSNKSSDDPTKLYGIALDTLHIIEKDLNVKFQHIPTNSWKEAQEYFKEKRCDILNAAIKTTQREKFANFTKPFLELPLAIFTAKNQPLINKLDEIMDKTWSRQKGSGLINTIKQKYPNTKIMETASTHEALELVNNNKVHFTISTLPVASHYINKYQFDNIQISGYPNITYKLAIAVQKDNTVLLDILNKSLSKITPKESNAILKSWSNVSIKHAFLNNDFIMKILLVLVIIAILIFYRQYLLKKSNNKLQTLVDEKTKALQELNSSLEDKIQLAIQEKREQDKILNTQSKMVSMGEMIGNIAHQWRQPLSVISTGVTGMQLQKEYGLLEDEKFNQTCTMINENVQYLSRTIDDFKNFIQGDRIKKKFNLKNNIETFLHLVEGTTKSNHIDIIINIENTITINGYDNELTQCFINIFNNAKDALKETNTKKKLIIIDASIKNDQLIIKFQDNAGGIPEKIIEKVFDPYFTTKHKSQGTGLGLHMTYRLIFEGMQGKITANNTTFTFNNQSYKGALFTIFLPLK